MSWSLGEAEALAVKAARGAGLPWGLAEEAGMALRWLEARSLPGTAALAGLLAQPPGGAPDLSGARPDRPVCPIRLGAALLDFADAEPGDLGEVLAPLLLVPFFALSGRTGALEWPGARAAVGAGEAAVSGGALLAASANPSFTPSDSPGHPPESLPRRTRVPETAAPHMAVLADFAARTYAPATEASRAGAGAGDTDND